jgi:hypothetical protein
VTAIATAVIAIATLMYTFGAVIQLGVMKDQLKSMEGSSADTKELAKAAKAQADAARATADAALAQAKAMETIARNAAATLDTMRDNLRLEQRPWVGPSGAKVSGDFKAGHRSTVIVAYQNTGKTPALSVVSRILARPFRADQHFVPPPTRLEGRDQSFVIFPLQTGESRYELVEESAADMTDLVAGTKKLYVWGEIQYDDAFGRHYRTTYCYFFEVDLTPKPCSTYAYAN